MDEIPISMPVPYEEYFVFNIVNDEQDSAWELRAEVQSVPSSMKWLVPKVLPFPPLEGESCLSCSTVSHIAWTLPICLSSW